MKIWWNEQTRNRLKNSTVNNLWQGNRIKHRMFEIKDMKYSYDNKDELNNYESGMIYKKHN